MNSSLKYLLPDFRKAQLRALERTAAQFQADTVITTSGVENAGLESARLENDQMMQAVSQLGQVEEGLAQIDFAPHVSQYDAIATLCAVPWPVGYRV